MFLKLLKHDMRSVWRFWWFTIPVYAIMTVLGTVSFRTLTTFASQMDVNPSAFSLLTVFVAYIFFMVSFIALSFCLLITEILVFFRFYKNMFTDEGYLTFTLPAKRSTILRAKTVNSYFWIALSIMMTAAGYTAMFVIGMPTKWGEFPINLEIFKGLWMVVRSLFETMGVWTLVYAAEAILILLISVFFMVALIQFCLTFGAMIVKKAKLLVGIAIYWVVNQALAMVIQFFVWIIGIASGTSFVMIWAAVGVQATFALIAIFIMILCIAMLIVSLTLYFTTRNCLERRLNLA